MYEASSLWLALVDVLEVGDGPMYERPFGLLHRELAESIFVRIPRAQRTLFYFKGLAACWLPGHSSSAQASSTMARSTIQLMMHLKARLVRSSVMLSHR